MSTLVTGFEPFDGRTHNGSWLAARALALEPGVRVLLLPVVWGAPLQTLHGLCTEQCPDTIIALGEGRPGWFDIETVARNRRAVRTDNLGETNDTPIIKGGPGTLPATVAASALLEMLRAAGHPARISRDAGGFLCEETLYTLERLKQTHHKLSQVVFCHVPPLGSTCLEPGALPNCEESQLRTFAADLLSAVRALPTAAK